MGEEYLKNSSDPEHWKKGMEYISAVLESIDMAAARHRAATPDDEKEAEQERQRAFAPAQTLMEVIGSMNWQGYRLTYTLGHIDTDHLALLCERKKVDWQQAFAAKAAFGTQDEVKTIAEAMKAAGYTPSLSSALTLAAKPFTIVNGLRHEGNLANVELLFSMGADANENKGNLYKDVVEQGRPDIGRVFARHASLSSLNLMEWVTWAKNNNKPKLQRDLRAIYWDYGRYTPMDSQTLLEIKSLGDNSSQLKIVFNFAAERVAEIYEVGPAATRQVTIKDFSFGDYDETAIQIARSKLQELGGSPAGEGDTLRDKKSAVRAVPRGLD